MPSLTIHLPDEVAHYAPHVQYFLQTMVNKLYTNRHKGFAETTSVDNLRRGLQSEVNELITAIADEECGQFEAYVEAVDVANMSLLTGMKLIQITREEYDRSKPSRQNTVASTQIRNRATVVDSKHDRGPERKQSQLPDGDDLRMDRLPFSGAFDI
jgi:hypothetical protein